jgi:hypothetical protein
MKEKEYQNMWFILTYACKDVSGQLHAAASLTPGKWSLVPIG